jgi:hypothetical protein
MDFVFAQAITQFWMSSSATLSIAVSTLRGKSLGRA